MKLFDFRCAHGALVSLLLVVGLHARAQFIATGVDEGAAPHVKVFSGRELAETLSFFAYGSGFTGGVRVAVADVNGDVKPDLITAAGPGGGPHVKVFDGTSGLELKSFLAFEAGFNSGIFVAAADVDNNGMDDVIVGTGGGTAAHVRVFSGVNYSMIHSFFPYGTNYTGGVRVAAGDVDGDGFADIITGTASGSSHVKVFSGQTKGEIGSYFAYGPTFQGGVFVAGGDVNGDGRADVITGAGAGGGPHVKAFNGSTATEIISFFPYDAGFLGGVRVAVGDVNGDGRAEIITATGPGGGPHVKAFDARTRAEVRSFFAYTPQFSGGVFVGSRAPRESTRFLATTAAATNVSFTTATLNAEVSANGGTATVSFQYGPDADLDSIIAAKPSEVTGRTPTTVSADLSGLTPGTTYSFRLVATDGLGDAVYGQPITFTATINPSPAGGTFFVLPFSPVTTGTTLTANFDGWTDQEGHTPLTYEVREGTTVLVPAGASATASFLLPAGTHQVHGRVYDTLGAFKDTTAVEIVVGSDPLSEIVHATGDSVPDAGSDGIPEDAEWTKFGVPAIDDLGEMAFTGKWESSDGRGGGVYHSDLGMLALIGGPVPGAGSAGDLAVPAGATFKSFKDPVIDRGGIVAFIATIAGRGVTAANDTVVVCNGRTGALEVIAREGSPAPGTNGAKFKFFNGVSSRVSQGPPSPLQPQQQLGGTIFTARLAGVRENEDFGAWWLPPGSASTTPTLLIRKGGPGFAPGETIRSFVLHHALPGSPGHGRGQFDADKALLQVNLSSGKQAMVLATPGELKNFTQSGDTFDENSSRWIRVTQPNSSNSGQHLSALGTFAPTSAPVDSRPGTGILKSVDAGQTWQVVAETGQLASNVVGIWLTVGFAVNSSTDGGLAFPARVKETSGLAYDGIWWLPEGGDLQQVARQGVQAAGCAPGEKWLAFKSLALPGGGTGPLFVATLSSGGERQARGRGDTGVWAVDRSGTVRLLFREGGTTIDDEPVKTFDVLREVSGSPGVARAFNARGEVAWQATFANGTHGIVVTQAP